MMNQSESLNNIKVGWHTHCIICGQPKDVSTEDLDKYTARYVCERCTNSFSPNYILYRLDCNRHGVITKEFENLEKRLNNPNFIPDADNYEIILFE